MKNNGLLTVKNFSGDFLSAVCRQSMHDNTFGLRLFQQRGIQLVVLEDNLSSPYIPNAWPDIRVQHISIFHSRERIGIKLDETDPRGLRLLKQTGMRFVPRWRRDHQMHRDFFGKFEPRIDDVVPVAHKHNLYILSCLAKLLQREVIRKDLTGVHQVRHGVDNRNSGTLGELDNSLVFGSPGNDQLVVTGQDGCNIVNRFACRNADSLLLEKNRMAAQLRDTNFERYPCPEGLFLENECGTFLGEWGNVALYSVLDLPGECTHAGEIFVAPG